MKIGNIHAIGETTGISGGGGSDTFLSSSVVTRMSGSMSSKIYRLDYLQSSGSFSGTIWSHPIGYYESISAEGTIVGFNMPPETGAGGVGGNRYFHQKLEAYVYSKEGTATLVGSNVGTPLKVGNLWKAGLKILDNSLALEVTNSIGGIVDWTSDFEIFVSRTTPTSYASPIFDANAIPDLWGWWDSSCGMFTDVAGTTPATTLGQKVRRWEDRGPNGLHATYVVLYGDDSKCPTYNPADTLLSNNPTLVVQRGTGNSSPNLSIDITNPGATLTIFTVHYYTSFADTAYNMVVWASANDYAWWTGRNGASGTDYPTIANPGGYYGVFPSVGGVMYPLSLSTPYIHVGTMTPGDAYIDPTLGVHLKVNGSNLDNHPFGNTGGMIGLGTKFGIGGAPADTSSWGNGLNGSLAEVIIYTRLLTNTEKTDIENYLKAKYGISY